MGTNAHTPEELELLLEDGLLLRDPQSLMALFAGGAVLVIGEDGVAHGEDITRLALATWHGVQTYVAAPQRVIQARDLALIVSKQGVNVVRRDRNGIWSEARSVGCAAANDQ